MMMANNINSYHRKLDGKVAIITGGASGIGDAAVRLFVENGAKVVIADIQDDKASRVVHEVGVESCVYKRCDVSMECDVEAVVSFTLEKWGKLDIMYNNAGILGESKCEDMLNVDMEDLDNVMKVNVQGMILGVKHASKAMVRLGIQGSIICTGSVSSSIAGMGPIAYTISKHAILGLVRAAASDLGRYGIRVNCISPWGVITPLLLTYLRRVHDNPSMTSEEARASRDSHANLAPHSLSPIDVAMSALYLASDDSKFVSGLNLVIDGGFTITNHILLK